MDSDIPISQSVPIVGPLEAPVGSGVLDKILLYALAKFFRVGKIFYGDALQSYFREHIEKVAVPVSRDLNLHGLWFRRANREVASNGLLVLLHGVLSCKESTLGIASLFSSWGYDCLLFDGRGHGASGRYCTFGFYEKNDVSRIIDAAEKLGLQDAAIGLWGTSLGGAIALQSMVGDARIRCAIVESTFANLREITDEYEERWSGRKKPLILDTAIRRAVEMANFKIEDVSPENMAPLVTQPVLMIHGTEDQYISIDHGRRVFTKLANPESKWLQIEGGNHHQLIHFGGNEYEVALKSFLEKHLINADSGLVTNPDTMGSPESTSHSVLH